MVRYSTLKTPVGAVTGGSGEDTTTCASSYGIRALVAENHRSRTYGGNGQATAGKGVVVGAKGEDAVGPTWHS